MAWKHRTGVIRQVTNALRKTFDAGFLSDPMFQSVYVGPEFQFEESRFPMVIIRYHETVLRNIGLGHSVQAVDEEGFTQDYRHWYFEGNVVFSVLALNQFERDTLMDAVSNVIGAGRFQADMSPFWQEIYDDDFIILNMATENLQPGGVGTQPTPWEGENELVHTGQYIVRVTGEFFSDPQTNEMVRIRQVNVYPYREDQEIPSGTPGDPAEWI